MGTVKQFPPSQQELHAFVDDELSPADRARIIQWLSDHPDKRRELLELRLRETLLRNAIKNAKTRDATKPTPTVDVPEGNEQHSRNHDWTIVWIICGIVALLLAYVITAH